MIRSGRSVRAMVILSAFLSVLGMLVVPPTVGVVLGLTQLLEGTFEHPASLGYRSLQAGVTTMCWSLSIGGLASVLGRAAGRRLATRPRPIEASLWAVPVLLSPAILFDAWWLEVGPDTTLGAWAAMRDHVPLLRQTILAIGLLSHALPLAVWAHAAMGPDLTRALQLMDRPRGLPRLVLWWRLEAAELARVGLLVAMIVAGLTVPFDLAQVQSIGFELRTLDTRGGSMGTLLLAGWWAIPTALIGAMSLTHRLRGAGRGRAIEHVAVDSGGRVGLAIGMSLVVMPLWLLSNRALQIDLLEAWSLHGPAAAGTLRMVLAGAGFGAVIAAGCAILRARSRRGATIASLVVAAFTMLTLIPATLIAAGAEAAWNRPSTSAVYDGPTAMYLAVVCRIAVVPAVLGCVLVPRVGEVGGGPLSADAPWRLLDVGKACRPTIVRAVIGGALAGGVLAAGEIPVTARLQPPGFPLLSTALLNAMHYQYVDSVLPVVLPVSLVAIPIAVALAWLTRGRGIVASRSGSWLLCMVFVVLAGCSPTDQDGGGGDGPPPLSYRTSFGRPGNLDGRFDYPRAIAIDPASERIFVVDKSARIQRFTVDGTLERTWRMPRFENGKPTGISIAPDGRVIVADTHEHRIAIFSPDGELLETHGRMGRGPGEFIYPTDVVVGPDGRWYVSEYGGNDRIQIFDAGWNPVGVIGFAGEFDDEDRPAFSRPQSMVWDVDRAELFVADAIHHRIVVTDADGRLLRVLGGPGREPGRFSYPYGIGIDVDGTLVILEFGANRVQRIDPKDGRCLAIAGGTGVEPGRLRYPWAIDVADGTMAVLDSGNARVLVGPPPDIGTGIGPDIETGIGMGQRTGHRTGVDRAPVAFGTHPVSRERAAP